MIIVGVTISLIDGLMQTAVGTSGDLGTRAFEALRMSGKRGHQGDATLLGELIVMSIVHRRVIRAIRL
jgi:hypothetical protein